MKKKKKVFWNKRSGKMISSSEMKTGKSSGKKKSVKEEKKQSVAEEKKHKDFAKKFSRKIKKAARDDHNT